MRSLGFVAAALLLAGCASAPDPAAPPVERITYETSPGPFCGDCDSLKFTASSDGWLRVERGWWAGRYRDWQTARERRRITPEQFARFRDALAAHRPVGARLMDDQSGCTTYAHDQPEVVVIWRGGGPDGELRYDFGCNFDHETAIRSALIAAPRSFGLANPDWSERRRSSP